MRHVPTSTASWCAALLLPLLMSAGGWQSALAEERRSVATTVATTHNDAPFEYRVESETQKSGYRILYLKYPSPVTTDVPQNNTVPAEYYLPDGAREGSPPRPAVIGLHILDGSFTLARLTCAVLASHGVPAMMIKLPYYGERSLPEGRDALATDPVRFVSALEQAGHDIRRGIDLLASREEVDGTKIGITGISLGGITAASLAGHEPRIHRAALILAGGDLNHVIHHAGETRGLSAAIRALPEDRQKELEAAITAVDPLTQAPGLRDRAEAGRVLMVNATEDTTIPPAATRKLADALGIADRVVWLEGLGHYTAMAELPRVLRMTAEFFAQDLPDGAASTPAARKAATPSEHLEAFIGRVARFVDEPAEGRCHVAELHVFVTRSGNTMVDGTIRYVRGAGWRFRLEGELPGIGRIGFGQGRSPWILSGDDSVQYGRVAKESTVRDPLADADPGDQVKLRVGVGAVAGVALAPGILQTLVRVTDDTGADGLPAVEATLEQRRTVGMRLAFREDGTTPHELTFAAGWIHGTVSFRDFRTDTKADPALFEPPVGVPVEYVDPEIVYRRFAGILRSAIRNVE